MASIATITRGVVAVVATVTLAAACSGGSSKDSGSGAASTADRARPDHVCHRQGHLREPDRTRSTRGTPQHPDEKVTSRAAGLRATSSAQQMIQNAQIKSDAFSVLNLDVVWTAEFAANRWISRVARRTSSRPGQVPAATVDTAKYRDKLYGVPYTSDGGLLYYRKDLLDKAGHRSRRRPGTRCRPPATRCRRCPRRGMSCYAGQFEKYEGLTVNFSEAVNVRRRRRRRRRRQAERQHPARPRPGLNLAGRRLQDGHDPEGRHHLQGRARPPGVPGRQAPLPCATGPTCTRWPSKTDGSQGRRQVRRRPAARHRPAPACSTLGGHNFAISPFAKNKATALEFIKFLTSEEQAERRNLGRRSAGPDAGPRCTTTRRCTSSSRTWPAEGLARARQAAAEGGQVRRRHHGDPGSGLRGPDRQDEHGRRLTDLQTKLELAAHVMTVAARPAEFTAGRPRPSLPASRCPEEEASDRTAAGRRPADTGRPRKQPQAELVHEGTGRLAALLLSPTIIVLVLVVGIPIARGAARVAVPRGNGLDADGFVVAGRQVRGPDELHRHLHRRDRPTRSGTRSATPRSSPSSRVVLETVLGVAMALVMNRAFRGRAFVRASILVPWADPDRRLGLLWRWIFQADGIANDAARHPDPVDHRGLRTPSVAVIIADTWKTAPFIGLLVLAGLQIDPGRRLRGRRRSTAPAPGSQFSRITLPLVKPALLVAVLFRILDTLRMFDLPFVLIGPQQGLGRDAVDAGLRRSQPASGTARRRRTRRCCSSTSPSSRRVREAARCRRLRRRHQRKSKKYAQERRGQASTDRKREPWPGHREVTTWSSNADCCSETAAPRRATRGSRRRRGTSAGCRYSASAARSCSTAWCRSTGWSSPRCAAPTDQFDNSPAPGARCR